MAVADHRGVMAVDHEQRLLERHAGRPVAPGWPGIETELLEQAIAGGSRASGRARMGAEVGDRGLDVEALLDAEQEDERAPVEPGVDQVGMGTARGRAKGGPGDDAAEPVAEHPFRGEAASQIAEDVLSQPHDRAQ